MLNDIEAQRVKRVMNDFVAKRRPPAHLRDQVDVGYEISGQSVEAFEIRPRFMGAPGEITRLPIFKATYVKSKRQWKLFWFRASGKWESYEPAPTAKSLEEILAVVGRNEHCCFG